MKYLLIGLFAIACVSCNFSEEKKETNQSVALELGSSQNELQISIQNGNELYLDFCIRCHLADGKGIENSFPPLANADYLIEERSESIKAVKYGQSGEITVNGITYNNVMAPMGLSDQEVADVMNYVMNSWGNKQQIMVTKKEVAAVEK